MKKEKWLLSFIFILLALVITMNIIALLIYLFTYLLIYFFAKVYFYFVSDVPFEGNLSELARVIKGASLGGGIVGLGCWYASFKNER
ncbi:hypothetical protein MUA01_16780 [Enterobacteriaceae bacterium H18W14]|uniref:hypothetical protein n=1 Tax=Dryocola boscaweniae TaxID=2925397 RepID=UPI0022F09A5A|nr:hypothetical protein [Dryocola boscaweniae]MCT4716619.1 hypothetical protein [Dryocola boscaweniae]